MSLAPYKLDVQAGQRSAIDGKGPLWITAETGPVCVSVYSREGKAARVLEQGETECFVAPARVCGLGMRAVRVTVQPTPVSETGRIDVPDFS